MNESLEYITVGDMIEGSIGNMSDKEIDRDIAMYNRISKIFGMSSPDDIICYVDTENQYDPTYINAKLVDKRKDVEVYGIDDGDIGTEFDVCVNRLNGNIFLFFESEKDADRYFEISDEYMNEGSFEPDLSMGV